MRICPNPKCGKTIENGNAKFCRYCGAKLSVNLEASVADEVTRDEVINAPDEGIVLTPSPALDESRSTEPAPDSPLIADGIALGFTGSANAPGDSSVSSSPANNINSNNRPNVSKNLGIKDILLIILAIIVAIIAPFYLMSVIYPFGQHFLPGERIILTPGIRIMCTLVMAIIDYLLAYVLIFFSSKRNKIVFNIICFFLTLLWNCFVGVFWYIVVTD